MMHRFLQLTWVALLFGMMGCIQEAPAPPKETVVLLHGMGRTRASLWVLEKRLKKAGYATLNFPYTPPLEPFEQHFRSFA